MADSAIEWTDKTWNPVRGCAKVSAGCKNCYAETMAKRLRAMGQRGYLNVIDDRGRWAGVFETAPSKLAEPLSWRKPARVFVNSMSDLFGEGVPFEFIAAVFGVMAATPRHTYQVLTKRPVRMLEFFAWLERQHPPGRPRLEVCWATLAAELATKDGDGGPFHTRHCADPDGPWPLKNVWLGVSVEDQAAADERIPLLLQAPAAVRFLSCEPLLDSVNLRRLSNGGDALWPHAGGVDWVIVGGESGPCARPCEVSGIRSIVRQCTEAGVACFVKQLGGHARDEHHAGAATKEITDRRGGDPSEWPEDLRVRQWPETAPSDDGVW